MFSEDPSNMSAAEREIWCTAWRLLVRHGDDTQHVIDAEMARLKQAGDAHALAEWQKIAMAATELANC